MDTRSGKTSKAAKILVTIVGALFILWALNDVGLALIGKTAKVIDIYTSRIGNRDSEQHVDKEYKWSVSWTFEADGKEYDGRASTRGSATGVKHGETVYYYSFLPQVNSIYAKENAGIWTVVQIGISVILIIAANIKSKKEGRFGNKSVNRAENELNSYNNSVEGGRFTMIEKNVLAPDSDGKYHWYYELNLFTNPTVFFTLIKVFGGIVLGMGLFVGLVADAEMSEKISLILNFWLFGIGGALVLIGIFYVIYAIIQGGKYCVIFEMDAKSITHIQTAKQFQKAEVIAALATLTGIAKGSLTLTGTGILAGCRSSMKTDFKNVDRIKIKRRRMVIYLHAAFSWNQIYVQPESFDTVLAYILDAIPDGVSCVHLTK